MEGYPQYMRRTCAAFLLPFLILPFAHAKDPVLQEAGAPYAPLDVSRKGQDPLIPLSKSQRNELLGEFKGLVHMGLRKVTLQQWEGKEMADCEKPQSFEDHWSYRCEIITGQ